jgi:hypothetical protein
VALAHAAQAAGWELVDDPARAERIVVATGALDRDLRLVPADYSLTVKAERVADLVRAGLANGARIAAFIPRAIPGWSWPSGGFAPSWARATTSPPSS